MSDEFERLNQIADETFDRAMRKTGGMILLGSLTDVETTVVLVFHVLGLVGGMGLEYMLDDEMDDDPGYIQTIEAYRRIGAIEIAAIIEEGLQRKELLEAGRDASSLRDYDSLDTEIYSREHECIKQLGWYVLAKDK